MPSRRFTSCGQHSHPVPVTQQSDVRTTDTVIVGEWKFQSCISSCFPHLLQKRQIACLGISTGFTCYSFPLTSAGNGPSALFLSYLLHGNVPIYDPTTHGPHPDPVLHSKLTQIGSGRPLYDALDSPKTAETLTEHFPSSTFMSYSSQALPINVLLDTLVRPNADTEIGESKSRIRWERDPARRVDHLVLGDAGKAGGQWAEDAIGANWDCETLRFVPKIFHYPRDT